MAAMARVPGGGQGRTVRVKNKNPSRIQITAEQLVREARDVREHEFQPPQCEIKDSEELLHYRLRRRCEFEHLVRRDGASSSSMWMKYARWEESQRDMARARSVFERALDATSHRDHTLWLNYAGFEMRNRCVDSARNVWDRAVAILPRVDQLWYKYAHMEEMLGAVANARQVFERWTAWRPGPAAWESYARFELRYGEAARARAIYERLVGEHPLPDAFVRYAKFEKRHGDASRARGVYERAVSVVDPAEGGAELLFLSFARFEEMCRAPERARAVYSYGLDCLPNARADELRGSLLSLERQFGQDDGIEDAITAKRRAQYEHAVTGNPQDYDSWIDYVRLEESAGDMRRIRAVYERAVANVPPAEEKRHWRRYIYLWIMHALYEEMVPRDVERARNVYRDCLRLIPHEKFSFSKLWIMAAQLEIRQKNLTAARRILGNAIGRAPNKHKIYTKYTQIELQLGNIARCRTLYERYIQWAPANCDVWLKYIQMEESLGEDERARAVYQLAMKQSALLREEVFPHKKEANYFDSDQEDAAKGIKRKRPVPSNLKILEAAYSWKQQKRAQ